MNGPNLIGLSGAFLAGSAYLPQITHLIKERCTAGLSRSAFGIWFLASTLVTINAFYIRSVVFIFLGVVQILSTALIFIYTTRFKGYVAPTMLNSIAN